MKHLLVDYLTISFKFTSEFKCYMLDCFDEVEKINYSANFSNYFRIFLFETLRLPENSVQQIKSRYGYNQCLYYDGISIHIDDDICVIEMSGKGCRTAEDLNPSLDWFRFISNFDAMIRYRNDAGDPPPVHISRLDIAFDDLGNKIVTLPLLQKYVRLGKYVCRAYDIRPIPGTCESSIYFGSPGSDRRLRIYDKRLEQRGLDSDVPWVRYEFQLRNDCALSFYFNLCNCDGDFGKCYFGVLSDFLTFTSQSKFSVGHHTDRLEPVKWWTSLVGDVLKLNQLYLPGREYTIKSVTDFFNTQCLSSAKTVLLLELAKNSNDPTSFLDLIMSADLNEKQQKVVDSYYNEVCKKYECESALGDIL